MDSFLRNERLLAEAKPRRVTSFAKISFTYNILDHSPFLRLELCKEILEILCSDTIEFVLF